MKVLVTSSTGLTGKAVVKSMASKDLSQCAIQVLYPGAMRTGKSIGFWYDKGPGKDAVSKSRIKVYHWWWTPEINVWKKCIGILDRNIVENVSSL